MSRKTKLIAGIVLAVLVAAVGLTASVIVTVTGESRQPVIVRDAASLTSAFSSHEEGTIVLANDITIDGDLTITDLRSFDLYGHSLTVNGRLTISSEEEGEYDFGGDAPDGDGIGEGRISAGSVSVDVPNADIDWYGGLSVASLGSFVIEDSGRLVFGGTFAYSDGSASAAPGIVMYGGDLVLSSASDNIAYAVTVPVGADNVRVENGMSAEGAAVYVQTAASVRLAGRVNVAVDDGSTDVTLDAEENADITLADGIAASITGRASSVIIGQGAAVSGNVEAAGSVENNGIVYGDISAGTVSGKGTCSVRD